jgi:hypothetical protein
MIPKKMRELSDWGMTIAKLGPSAPRRDATLELLLEASGTGTEQPQTKPTSEKDMHDIARNEGNELMLLNTLITFEMWLESIDVCVDSG